MLSGFGYDVRRNDPYAGGYVTRHYGRPRDDVHALQIEVARRLYMDESSPPEIEPRSASCSPAWTALMERGGGVLHHGCWPPGKKKAVPCSTAKFREETSKK